MSCHLHRELPPLPGFCRCGQRLPLGPWPHPDCPRCRGRGEPQSAIEDPPPWYAEDEGATWLGDVLFGLLVVGAILAVLFYLAAD
jgi:hypothetical protein